MSDCRVTPLNVRKFSPSHLNDFEKEVTYINYDPMNPVDNIFNNIEDLL